MPLLETTFCSIRYPDGMGHGTMAKSLFQAAANALHWAEVDCPTFGNGRRYRDDQVLVVGVGMVPDRWYRVRIGRRQRPAGPPPARAQEAAAEVAAAAGPTDRQEQLERELKKGK